MSERQQLNTRILGIILALTFSNISCYSIQNYYNSLKRKAETGDIKNKAKMSYGASETTEVNYPPSEHDFTDLFLQQEDIKYLQFALVTMGDRCVCHSLCVSTCLNILHYEYMLGIIKAQPLWSCNPFVLLALLYDAANPFTEDLCPVQRFFKMKRS